jgi:hypothetical protein
MCREDAREDRVVPGAGAIGVCDRLARALCDLAEIVLGVARRKRGEERGAVGVDRDGIAAASDVDAVREDAVEQAGGDGIGCCGRRIRAGARGRRRVRRRRREQQHEKG